MARRVVVVVQQVAVETGLWCDVCALPSAVAYVRAMWVPNADATRRILRLDAYRTCVDHG